MLYIQDQSGDYLPAPQELVLSEATRITDITLSRGASISSSEIAKEVFKTKLSGYEYELFACLFLDTQNRVLAFEEKFRGSIRSNTIHPREVVKEALWLNAAAVIFGHNHPSGASGPSSQDIELTNKLKDILAVIDVIVLDHLVIGMRLLRFKIWGI